MSPSNAQKHLRQEHMCSYKLQRSEILLLNLHCLCHHFIDYSLQALLASGYTQGNYEQARQVICRVLQVYNNFLPFRILAFPNDYNFFFSKGKT